MFLSKRVKDLSPSSTLQITSLAKKLASEGIDVVSFGAGEPDFDTPDFIKEAAIEAIRTIISPIPRSKLSFLLGQNTASLILL